MPGYYKTTFSVYGTNELDRLEGPDLLSDVQHFIIERLSADQDQPPLERDYDGDEDVAYSVIRTERPVSTDGDIFARLEVRLWANDEDVQLAVESQVIAPHLEGDQSYRYSPPRLVSALTKRYLCVDYEAQVSSSPQPSLSASDIAHLLYKSRRQLPVLLISATNAGRVDVDSQRIAEQLLGLAHVAIIDPDRHASLGPGVYCYNGASRLLWPTPTPRYSGPSPKPQYFSPQQTTRKDFLSRLRHSLLTDPPHFSFFEETFLQIRSDCVYQRNLNLEQVVKEAKVAPTIDDYDLKRLSRQLRKSEKQRKSLKSDNARLQDEINKMQTEITDLNGRLSEGSTTETFHPDSELMRRLQADLAEKRLQVDDKDAEIAVLQKKIGVLNTNIKDLRLSYEELRTQTPKTNFIDNISPSLKLLTSLNHALNIARDPIRKYIVRNLRQAYDGNLLERFQYSINMDGIDPDRARKFPESVIDFAHFPNLVRHNPEAFKDAHYLSGLLEKIRRDRNKVIHPFYGAANITGQLARELLNNIISIRKAIDWRGDVLGV